MKIQNGWLARLVRSEIAVGICSGLLIGAGVLAIVRAISVTNTPTAAVTTASPPPASRDVARLAPVARFADLGDEPASHEVRYIADWIADSGDAAGSAFVIVDKQGAKVYVFDANARLRAASAVLLGGAKGDDTVPGIGSRPIEQVLPEERTTPAGRFIGERGHDARGEDVVWVDYDAAVSMHRVLTINPTERRLERLATPTIEDNRISYGCINVPVAFYETYIQPMFAKRRAVVYVLPEVKPLQQVFAAYDVSARRDTQGAAFGQPLRVTDGANNVTVR